jgi:hypothetical protein
MLQIVSRSVIAALTLAVAVAASSTAQAHHGHRKGHAAWPRTDYLLYSYDYHPIIGYSRYGNCYWVEDFAPYRPHLIRQCPVR